VRRNGNRPLKMIMAKEGKEFWTIALSLGLDLMILASQGKVFLI